MCPAFLEVGVDIHVVYKMPHCLSVYSRAVQSMTYWNSVWTRFTRTPEGVPPGYEQPKRDQYGNLCSIHDMMSSECFNFSRMVQAEIIKVLSEMVTYFQISPDAYMDDLLSEYKADWKAATLLIIKTELMHLANQLTPISSHSSPKHYQQMQVDRANFESNHLSAIHTKIRDILTELIQATQTPHDSQCFEHKQHDAWQYFAWACANNMYNCSPRGMQKIRTQMPTLAVV